MELLKKIIQISMLTILLTIVFSIGFPLVNLVFEGIASIVNGTKLTVTYSTLKASSEEFSMLAVFLAVTTSTDYFRRKSKPIPKSNKTK